MDIPNIKAKEESIVDTESFIFFKVKNIGYGEFKEYIVQKKIPTSLSLKKSFSPVDLLMISY